MRIGQKRALIKQALMQYRLGWRHVMRFEKVRYCIKHFSLVWLVCFLPVLLIGGQTLQGAISDDYKPVIVKKGDSISYLCFKLYKKYNQTIIEALKKANPKIKNINKIYIGQTLHFPRLSRIERVNQPTPMPTANQTVVNKTDMPNDTGSAKDASAEDALADSKAYITNINGMLRVQKYGADTWQNGHVNEELQEGDKVKVDSASKAEIITNAGSIIRLSEQSELTVDTLKSNPQKDIQASKFSLTLGRLWNKAKKIIHPKSEYLVSTPTAVTGIRGTVYSIDIMDNKNTLFRTYDGKINVRNPFPVTQNTDSNNVPVGTQGPRPVAGPKSVPGPTPVSMNQWTNILLKKHQELIVTPQGNAIQTDFNPATKRNDEWVKWNLDRDQEFENSDTWI